MPDKESLYTRFVLQKGEELHKAAKQNKPGIPLGMKRVTPEEIRRRWADLDDEGKRALAAETGLEAIVEAHRRLA